MKILKNMFTIEKIITSRFSTVLLLSKIKLAAILKHGEGKQVLFKLKKVKGPQFKLLCIYCTFQFTNSGYVI